MSARTLPMQGRLPDFLRMQASRDSKPVRENLMSQAADALEAQEKRIAELEGALEAILEHLDNAHDIAWGDSGSDGPTAGESIYHARRVLGGQR